MDETLKFMINKEWTKDYKLERKLYLLRIAKEGMASDDISNKIGSTLIYNQVVEQLLKEVIIASIAYIKAEIWPNEVQFNIDLDKATFGKQIKYFKDFAVKELNRENIVKYLYRLKKQRDKVVHELFEIKELDNLRNQLVEYGYLAQELVILLNEYYDQISWRLFDLDERVNFSLLISIDE